MIRTLLDVPVVNLPKFICHVNESLANNNLARLGRNPGAMETFKDLCPSLQGVG